MHGAGKNTCLWIKKPFNSNAAAHRTNSFDLGGVCQGKKKHTDKHQTVQNFFEGVSR